MRGAPPIKSSKGKRPPHLQFINDPPEPLPSPAVWFRLEFSLQVLDGRRT
jgi:hypothetical protein